MSIVQRDKTYYDGLRESLDKEYEKQVDRSFSRTDTPEEGKARAGYRVRAPLGRAIVLVETNEYLRKVGSVWLVDSSLSDLGPRVVRGRVLDVHPDQIEVGNWTRPTTLKVGDTVLIDRKTAKRLIRGVEPGMTVSVWSNYCIAVCG